MTNSASDHKKMHHDLTHVGLRAQATAAGLVQLCAELRRAKILEDAAIERVKDVIADVIVVAAPRGMNKDNYRRDTRSRLDRLFAGEEQIGPAEALTVPLSPEA